MHGPGQPQPRPPCPRRDQLSRGARPPAGAVGDARRHPGARGGASGRAPLRGADGRRSACWCSAAARARASSPTLCPPRSRCCRPRRAPRLRIVQQCRPEDMERVRAAYAPLRGRRRARPVLPDLPAAHRGGASGDCRAPAPRRWRSFPSSAGRRCWCRFRARSIRTRPTTPARSQALGGARRLDQEALTPERPRRRSSSASWTIRRAWPGMAQNATGLAKPDAAERLADLAERIAAGDTRMIAPLKMTTAIGPVHFVGIGGIGMSGIAEVLHNLGYRVQGSDIAESANVLRLRDKGIAVAIGHAAENLGEATVVVVSSAVKRDNPELMAARARLLPVVRRAEMLAELMRLKQAIAVGGTHGKTTTTSLVATLLEAGGLDPTVINGGIINAYGTNARLGRGRLAGRRGGRERRHVRQAPGRHRHRHQHRPRAPRPLRRLRRCARRLPPVRRERAVLRLRGDVHRPSGSAGDGRAHRGPSHHHLRRQPAGGRALHERAPRPAHACSTFASPTASPAASR